MSRASSTREASAECPAFLRTSKRCVLAGSLLAGSDQDATNALLLVQVDLQVKVRSSATDEQLNELFQRSAVRCPIHSLLHAAGVDISFKWTRFE